MPAKFKTRFKMAVPFASKFPIQSDSSSTSMSITFPVDGVKMFAPAGGRKQLFIPNAGIEMFDIERGRKQLLASRSSFLKAESKWLLKTIVKPFSPLRTSMSAQQSSLMRSISER
jgi:hypothetical protein